MRKLFYILFLFCFSYLTLASDIWGPKIKLKTVNDIGQSCICYIGVDAKATDGWDKDIIFYFDNKELKEYEFLPPPPPNSIYCVIVKDSLLPYDSDSYVDFKHIPEFEDKFKHKYRMNVVWGKYSQNITIKWGKLPVGIDSAHFSCYEWMDGTEPINMKEVEEILIDNEAHRRFDFTIWYNKKHTSINSKEHNFVNNINNNSKIVNSIFPIEAGKYVNCMIMNICGGIVFNTDLDLKDKELNIGHLMKGIYFMQLIDFYGNIEFFKIIKL